MARYLTIGLAASMVLAACGCGNNNNKSMGNSTSGQEFDAFVELVPKLRPYIPDLPVPIGFDLNEGKSRSFTAGGARFIDHVYKGSEDKFTVARFYKRYMPSNRWTLTTDLFLHGAIILEFEKETERCDIEIGKGSLFHPTSIKVRLYTSRRIEANSSKE